ncbi:MAG: DUF1028 domain-containing protein [Candidatus Eisenbacteria bacterium]
MRSRVFFLVLAALIPSAALATYSIVALDPETGEIGVAVQSRAFNVGMAVPWVEAGVGAIATQAFTNESFGPRGLALMRTGLSAEETLAWLLDHDPSRENRQVGIVDANGGTAQHTGSEANEWKGGIVGENFVCQGNILAGEKVVNSMAKAFHETDGELAARLLAALLAGEAAGGDSRGKQSAAILVGRPSDANPEYRTRYVDLRVDDHPEPLLEIERLYHIIEGTDLAQAHIRYAEEYRAGGDDASAEREIRRLSQILDGALAREDTDAGTLNALAWSLATNDTGLESALEAARRAALLVPDSFEILDTLAETLFRLGRYDEAIETGKNALALSPDDDYLEAQLRRFEGRRIDLEPGEGGE